MVRKKLPRSELAIRLIKVNRRSSAQFQGVCGVEDMRSVMIVAAILGITQSANAADLPFLRGGFSDEPLPAANWGGGYIGGQATYGAADMDFSQSSQDPLARMLANTYWEDNRGGTDSDTRVSRWKFLDSTSSRNSGIGGFVGYNWQYEDVIYGLELNYTHGKFSGSGSGNRSIFYDDVTPGYRTTVSTYGNSSMEVLDFGSARVRGGYAFGNFLPYAFAGMAMGQANIKTDIGVNVSYTPSALPVTVPAIPTASSREIRERNAQFIYGYAYGLGFDYKIFGNLFVRGEWEYLRFTAPVDTTINTVRAGLGYKF